MFASLPDWRGSISVPWQPAQLRPHTLPAEISKLTAKRIGDWHTGLALAPKLLRCSSREIDAKNAEAVRARRATANRQLTVLKAALNYAFREGRVATDEAWRKVKPFREADAPVVRAAFPPAGPL